MIVSHNPHEDRSIKMLAGWMVALTVVLTTVRACQVVTHDTVGIFAAFTDAERLILEDHFSRVERHRAQSRTSDPG